MDITVGLSDNHIHTRIGETHRRRSIMDYVLLLINGTLNGEGNQLALDGACNGEGSVLALGTFSVDGTLSGSLNKTR